MKINVLYFGILADIVGCSEKIYENIPDVATLELHLNELYPDFKTYRYKFSVNQVIAELNTVLNDGDEVAILPPFAGG